MIFKSVTLEELETTYAPARENAQVRAYWVPIMFRETMLEMYRERGIKVRIRYRGPRDPNRLMKTRDGRTYRRGKYSAQITCLMEEATHFTVYCR